MILLFSTTGDDALATAAWVAEQTRLRLSQAGFEVAPCLPTRGGLAQALPPCAGLAAFAHGQRDALIGADDAPALDEANITILCGKWAWVFACRTAHSLASAAVEAGATCFVGFEVPVLLNWSPNDIPPELLPLARQLLTEVALLLANGVHTEGQLLAHIEPIEAQVADWYLDNPDAAGGFDITAQQLLRRLVVRSSLDETECLRPSTSIAS